MKFMKKFYDWVLHWAQTPYSVVALFCLSLAESSFFPVPPDVLLIAMCVAAPHKALRYAFICTVASVLGGIIGYYIGLYGFELIGVPILSFYDVLDKFEWIKQIYQKYDAIAVMTAGFTPIPYKVFTIGAGACELDLPVFVGASVIGRGLRFFVIGGLIYHFGPHIKKFIEDYFSVLSYLFMALFIIGLFAIKLVF